MVIINSLTDLESFTHYLVSVLEYNHTMDGDELIKRAKIYYNEISQEYSNNFEWINNKAIKVTVPFELEEPTFKTKTND
jgi:hypothetical protein